ncbi:RNA-binding protein [uncultured archaeon]|nr:RNA-binding protein [uncultured archaeon]
MHLKQSSLDFYAFTNYYREKLVNSFIKKIYQIGPSEYLFQLYRSDTKKVHLFISLTKGIMFHEAERPGEASPLALSLRRMLSERRITGIEQINFDRVVKITLHTGQELILELFREGNLIITNNGLIEYAFNQREWRNRKIIRGEPYKPPMDTNPLDFTDEEFLEKLGNSKASIVQTLATRLSLGGENAEEVVFRLGIDKDTPAKESTHRMKDLRRMINELLQESVQGKAYLYEEESVISPVELKHIRTPADKAYEDLSDGFSHYLLEYAEADKEKTPMERRIDSQRRAIGQFKEKQEELAAKGTIVMRNLQLVQSIIKELNKRIKNEKLDSITIVQNQKVESIDPVKKIAIIEIEGTPIEVDYTKSAGENGNRLFSTSKDFRNKISGALTAIEDTKKNIILEQEKPKKKKRIKQWFEIYHWFYSSEGFLVISGRDARTNEKIVKKHLKDHDLYMHADFYGAPSTIIKVEGESKPTEKTLREAASFAVSFSRGWAAGIANGSAYWVYPSQVSKTPESGEFIATGSWVIRGKRNYVLDVPLSLEIGLIELKNEKVPMICPTGVFEEDSTKIVRILPGGEKRPVAAKRISEMLGVLREEIESILPPGSTRILE